MKTLVLASSSPRRKEILEHTGIPFIIDAGEYEEDMSLDLPPHELVKYLALGKAMSVAGRHANSIIIGADTFITLDGRLLGKSYTVEQAREMLSFLNGRSHSVVSGFAVVDTTNGKTVSTSLETKVTFREMTEQEIDGYIASGEPLNKAGSYAIQGMGGVFIEKIEGDYTCVMGLPLCPLVKTLQEFGVSVFNQSEKVI